MDSHREGVRSGENRCAVGRRGHREGPVDARVGGHGGMGQCSGRRRPRGPSVGEGWPPRTLRALAGGWGAGNGAQSRVGCPDGAGPLSRSASGCLGLQSGQRSVPAGLAGGHVGWGPANTGPGLRARSLEPSPRAATCWLCGPSLSLRHRVRSLVGSREWAAALLQVCSGALRFRGLEQSLEQQTSYCDASVGRS